MMQKLKNFCLNFFFCSQGWVVVVNFENFSNAKKKIKGGGGLICKWPTKIACFQQKNFLNSPWSERIIMYDNEVDIELSNKVSIAKCG